MRAVCIAYMVFLTLLLLSSDPAQVIGLRHGIPWVLQALMPYAHLLSFSVLAVLALAIRWPMARWLIVLAMVMYGGTTEIIQGFVPHRTPDWMDWLQDLGGIAVGTAICWIAALAVGQLVRRRQSVDAASGASASDEWENLREALSRPATGEQSWWS